VFKLLEKTEVTRKYQCTLERESVNAAMEREQKLAVQSGSRDFEAIASRAFHSVIQEQVVKIQKEDDITVLNLSNMSLDGDQESDKDQEKPILCTVDLECLPTVPWEKLKGKQISIIDFQPKENEVDELAHKELVQKAGDLVDELSVQQDSLVQVKITCRVDGKILPAYTAQKAVIDMKKKDFWPEVLDALLNRKTEESFESTVELSDASSPLLRNKKATFHVVILGIKKFILAPKADDEAAQKIGAKSLEDFMTQFQSHIQKTALSTVKELRHRAIMALISELTFAVPQSILEERMAHQRQSAMNAILPRKKLSEDEEKYLNQAALNESKLVTFVLAYAKQNNIAATTKEIQASYTPKTPEEMEFYEGIVLEGKVLTDLEKHLDASKKVMSVKELQDEIASHQR